MESVLTHKNGAERFNSIMSSEKTKNQNINEENKGVENLELGEHMNIKPFHGISYFQAGVGVRKRLYSDSSDSTASSNSSFGIDYRDMALLFCADDETMGHELGTALSKYHSVHTLHSIPAGKHILEGLIKVCRHVELVVTIVTDSFVRKRRQFECMLQSRVCNSSNALLLTQEGVNLPLEWGHLGQINFSPKMLDVYSIRKDIENFMIKKKEMFGLSINSENIRVMGLQGCESVVVISDVLCFIFSYSKKIEKALIKSSVVNHVPITKKMIVHALCYLQHPTVNLKELNEGDELKWKLKKDRKGLIDELFDAVESHKTTSVKFVASDITSLPTVRPSCSVDVVSKFVKMKQDPDDNELPFPSQKLAALQNLARTSRTYKPRLDTGACTFSGSPTLVPIPEETKKVQHFLVKELPSGWKLDDVTRCMQPCLSNLKSITRMCKLHDKSTSFKIAITENKEALHRLISWPQGAKIVRFYFWKKQHFCKS